MTGVLKVKVDGTWVPIEEPPDDVVSPGPGVPTGGTVGQVLSKIDSAPYHTQWVTVSGGGGGAPTGSAGGALSGTYPNPGLASAIAGAGIGISSNVLSITAGTGITIGADSVGLTNVGANTIKGAVTAGAPADLTPAQVRTVVASDDGSTSKYLRADGTWFVPPDTNTDTLGSDGDKGDITVGGTGTTLTIDSGAVTYAKIQNVTNDRLLGRQAGTNGVIEEITCTSFARALLDDTSYGAMRTTLGLPTITGTATITVGTTQPTVGVVVGDLWVDTT